MASQGSGGFQHPLGNQILIFEVTKVGGIGPLTKTRRFALSPTQPGCYMCTSPDGRNPCEPSIKPTTQTQSTGEAQSCASFPATDKASTECFTSASLSLVLLCITDRHCFGNERTMWPA